MTSAWSKERVAKILDTTLSKPLYQPDPVVESGVHYYALMDDLVCNAVKRAVVNAVNKLSGEYKKYGLTADDIQAAAKNTKYTISPNTTEFQGKGAIRFSPFSVAAVTKPEAYSVLEKECRHEIRLILKALDETARKLKTTDVEEVVGDSDSPSDTPANGMGFNAGAFAQKVLERIKILQKRTLIPR